VNVPMYAIGRDHPRREASVWIMREIARGELRAIIDVEIIQEVLHRFGEGNFLPVGLSLARELMEIVPAILPIFATDVALAADLLQRHAPQGFRSRDAIHAAVMHNNGLTTIVTADRHFDLLPGVERIDPRALYERRG
jgi:hypothetical protein